MNHRCSSSWFVTNQDIQCHHQPSNISTYSLIFSFVSYPEILCLCILEHTQETFANKSDLMNDICHYNKDDLILHVLQHLIIMIYNCDTSIMCHMQWLEFRLSLPSKPSPRLQDISVLFHMSSQPFPTFIILRFFPLRSFYSNGFLTGQFPINHILPILNGIGNMLENLGSKNLFNHRTSILRYTQ